MASYLTWTPPTANSHPRIWINATTGPTLTEVIQNRDALVTAGSPAWQQLVAYEADHRTSLMSYYTLAEYGLAHAAVYLLGQNVISETVRTAAAERAEAVMVGVANAYSGTDAALPANNSTNRERLMMLGLMYDWLYNYTGFSDANKTLVRNAIVRFAARFLRVDNINDATPAMVLTEFLWGHATEDACIAIVGLSAILNDGTSEQNARWQGWMDYLLDMMDDGNESRMFPCYRYFAKNAAGTAYDGGTYKGSGDYSYITKREEAMNRMFPCMETALQMPNVWNSEAWYETWMHWILWHLRSDFHSHMQGESFQDAFFSHLTACHAMQVAQHNPTTALGQACQWFHKTYVLNQVPGNSYRIWGPYYIWVILWETASIAQSPPFLSTMNAGKQARIFENVAKVCFRTGWGSRLNSTPTHADYNKLDQKYTSSTLCLPRFFLGVHQIRDAGHFDLVVEGKPLLIKTGYYEGVQTLEYKCDAVITSRSRDPDERQYDPIVWNRSGTVVTVYKTAHGYPANGTVQVLNSTGATTPVVLSNGIKTIRSVTTNTFVIDGLNPTGGALVGTCHLAYPNSTSPLDLSYDGPVASDPTIVGDAEAKQDPTGHRKCFQARVVAHNCVGIHSVLEESMMSSGGNYENTYDDTLNFDATPAGFATFSAGPPGYGTKTIANCGDQLWPKDPTTRPMTENAPIDLRDIVGAAKKAQWCMEEGYAHFSDGYLDAPTNQRYWAYAVGDLASHYWTGKCTSYKRHYLWLGPNTVPGWLHPVIVLWDDITCIPDATFGNKTCTFRLHSPKPYTGSASDITLANGNSRAYIKVVSPVNVEKTDVLGYKIGNETFYVQQFDVLGDTGHMRDGSHDMNPWAFGDYKTLIDAGDHRIELNPPTNDANVDFIVAIISGVVPHTGVPTVDLNTLGNKKGVTINSGHVDALSILFNDVAPYSVTFGEDLAPAQVTGLAAVVLSQTRIDLDWDSNAEADFNYYLVERATLTGTTWGAWSVLTSPTPAASSFSDTTVSAGTTYRYRVAALDDAEQVGPYSDIVSATTFQTPPVAATGAGIAPWRPSRKFSKYWLDMS